MSAEESTLIAPIAPVPQAKRKFSFLPILVVLFLLSYGLMTMLVVYQGSTITSQSFLIKQLFVDSTELMAIKGKMAREQRTNPNSEPKPQAKSKTEVPSAQGESKDRAKTKDPKAQTRKGALGHPPKPASDLRDARRVLFAI